MKGALPLLLAKVSDCHTNTFFFVFFKVALTGTGKKKKKKGVNDLKELQRFVASISARVMKVSK